MERWSWHQNPGWRPDDQNAGNEIAKIHVDLRETAIETVLLGNVKPFLDNQQIGKVVKECKDQNR